MRCTTLLVPATSGPTAPAPAPSAPATAAAAGVPSVVRLLRRLPQVEHVSVVERAGGVVAFVCWSRGRPDHVAEQRLHDDLCALLLAAGVRPLPLRAPAPR